MTEPPKTPAAPKPYFSDNALEEMRREMERTAENYNYLLLAYSGHKFRSVRGKEFALQGYMRRIRTLRHGLETLFGTLPPDFAGLPDEDRLNDAEIIVQSFVFNLFGCTDNLARIWVEETGLVRDDGTPLPRNWIGLGSKYTTVRASLAPRLQELLASRQEWFVHMETLRHALAHRIPLYIPRFAVTPANQDRYHALEAQITEAVIRGRPRIEHRLRKEQQGLMFFRPWVAHSFSEDTPLIVIHPQMIVDYKTICELGGAFLNALRGKGTAVEAGRP